MKNFRLMVILCNSCSSYHLFNNAKASNIASSLRGVCLLNRFLFSKFKASPLQETAQDGQKAFFPRAPSMLLKGRLSQWFQKEGSRFPGTSLILALASW